MALCEEWRDAYPPYVSRPGLFRYRKTDFGGEPLSGKAVYQADPEEPLRTEPSAKCVVLRGGDNNKAGVVSGALVPAKYLSESWPCHRGFWPNPHPDRDPGRDHFDPVNPSAREYVSCLAAPDRSRGVMRYQPTMEWR